jgi:flavin-dependent dehydrogenase
MTSRAPTLSRRSSRSPVDCEVLLIGDAGQCGDPLNGGGIHKAIESAALAARVAAPALAAGDCSRDALEGYERLIEAGGGVDAQMGGLVLALAKNPRDRLARTPASLLFPSAPGAEPGPWGNPRSLTSNKEGGRYGYQPVRPVQQGH